MRSGYIYGLIIAIGLSSTGVAGWIATQSYNQAALGREKAQLDAATFAVRVALDRLAIMIRGVRGAYAAGGIIPGEFDIFIRTLTTAENFRAIAFLRRVTAGERPAYEAGRPQAIWERDDGSRVPAGARPVYYVIEAAYLSDGSPPLIGLDVASIPGRLEAINAAIADHSLYIYGPVAMGADDEQGLLMYAPAFDRRGNIIGVVLGTLPLNAMLFLAEQASGVSGIAFSAGAPNEERSGEIIQQSFDFGQRSWTVAVPRTPSDGLGPLPWATVLVVGAGLASTLAFLGVAAALSQNARLTEARQTLRTMLDGLGPLAWLLDSQGTILTANESAATALGLSQEEMIGRRFWELAKVATDDQRINQLRRAVATARSSGGVRFDVAVELGEEKRVFDIWIQPLDPGNERISGLVVTAVDVTDRYEAQQTQQLLTRELDHRMKNALQVIQAVIQRTALTQDSIGGFEKALSGRVRAMARAHELLAGERWLGADIETVLKEEISTLDPSDQIAMSGTSLRVNPKAALSFALAMHELGTNALKYGALSVSSGRIDVRWSVDRHGGEPRFELTWQEHGGPPVKEPTQRGFGSTLIERSISYELDGDTEVAYRPDGLYCRFSVPLSSIRPFATTWERVEVPSQ